MSASFSKNKSDITKCQMLDCKKEAYAIFTAIGEYWGYCKEHSPKTKPHYGKFVEYIIPTMSNPFDFLGVSKPKIEEAIDIVKNKSEIQYINPNFIYKNPFGTPISNESPKAEVVGDKLYHIIYSFGPTKYHFCVFAKSQEEAKERLIEDQRHNFDKNFDADVRELSAMYIKSGVVKIYEKLS